LAFPQPQRLQLTALLRAQINDGSITARLPSVKTLSQQHGVSHITAEKALAMLKEEGLIVAVIGKGYYVAGS
jgi:DNA-binding GntR family transcriptional regulator